VVFDEDDTNTFDGQRDALKMRSPVDYAPILSTVDASGIEYSINRITPNTKEIYFNSYAKDGGVYEISFENLGKNWILVDLQRNLSYPIGSAVISLDMSLGSIEKPRFLIRKVESDIQADSNELSAQCINESIQITGEFIEGELYNIGIFSASGQLVSTESVVANSNKLTLFEGLSKGAYVLQVTNKNKEAYTAKLIK
ncbi:MAG: T9SS type A sorting domain-containing protein, partial [Bacteroidota bacterium]